MHHMLVPQLSSLLSPPATPYMSGFRAAPARLPYEDLNLARLPPVPLTEPSPSSSISEHTATLTTEQDLDHSLDAGDDIGDDCPEPEDEDVTISAAERRAEQRRMKRFRLTHSQTRFLQSEFARQAHPDAAHRERLAREIPGLSSRQVQVWFQNRRAKLKRLPNDDRESMMRSRALPEGFDTTQALYPRYGEVQSMGRTLACDVSYSPHFENEGMVPPLTLDCLRQSQGDHVMPTPPNTNASFESSIFTPPGSALISPKSTEDACLQSPYAPESGHIGLPNGNPFSRSGFPSGSFRSQNYVPPLQLHEDMSRTRAQSLVFSPKCDLSYSPGPLAFSSYSDAERPSLTGPQPLGHDLDRTASNYPQQRYGVPFPGVTQLHDYQPQQQSQTRSSRTATAPELRHRLQPVANQAFPVSEQGYFAGLQSAPLSAPLDFQLSDSGPLPGPLPFEPSNMPSDFNTMGPSSPRMRSSGNGRVYSSNSVQHEQDFRISEGSSDGRRRSFTHPARFDSSR